MRCQKCQYLGFEPSPRCKNCGYDFSLGSDHDAGLTFVADAVVERETRSSDFDLQIFDDLVPRPAASVSAASGGFDLDDLLANGRSGRDPEPASVVSSAVASGSMRTGPSSASAVATPPAAVVARKFVTPPPVVEVSKTVEASMPHVRPPAPRAPRPVKKAIVADEVETPSPVTTELPLFMQVMSDVREPARSAFDTVDLSTPTIASVTITPAADVLDPDASARTVAAPVVEEVDDRPLVDVPATPRTPLSVRRATPDPARLRAKYARQPQASADLLTNIDAPTPAFEEVRVPVPERMSAEPTPQSLPAGWLQGVSASKRVTAAVLDVLLLAAVDAAVIWLTLNVCGLQPSEASLLPIAPIALFFLLLDGGYLVLFTAACGQTIGKMATGIRVVGTTTGAVINDRLTIAQALMRSAGSIVSCLPLGAGLMLGLLSDGRALHDRLAHTRVVRA